MSRILASEVGLGIAFGLLGGAVGFIANSGSHPNLSPLEFAGVRGYEATGLIGALFGAAILVPCGAFIVRRPVGARQAGVAWLASLVGAFGGFVALHFLGAAWFWPSFALPILGSFVGYRLLPGARAE